MKSELQRFYELADDIEIAMMTTRRPDGHMRSRAMANQKRASGADLWFVTSEGCDKLEELSHDPHVNLTYYRESSREWISVSGIATISRDRDKIHELYAPDWAMWFGQDGDPRHGTADDPRIVLIGVDRARGGVPGSEQAEGRRAVRAGEGVAVGHRAGARRDARAGRATTDRRVTWHSR